MAAWQAGCQAASQSVRRLSRSFRRLGPLSGAWCDCCVYPAPLLLRTASDKRPPHYALPCASFKEAYCYRRCPSRLSKLPKLFREFGSSSDGQPLPTFIIPQHSDRSFVRPLVRLNDRRTNASIVRLVEQHRTESFSDSHATRSHLFCIVSHTSFKLTGACVSDHFHHPPLLPRRHRRRLRMRACVSVCFLKSLRAGVCAKSASSPKANPTASPVTN